MTFRFIHKRSYGVYAAQALLSLNSEIHLHYMLIISFVIKMFLLNQKNGLRLFELSNLTATLTWNTIHFVDGAQFYWRKNGPSFHKKQNCTNIISYADDDSQTVHLGVWKWNLLTHTQWLRDCFRMSNVISCLRRSWIADVTLMSPFKFFLNHFQSGILWSLLTPEPSESEEGKIVRLMHPDCSFLPLWASTRLLERDV